ncbi:Nn.00g076480.m01.CDS01 [Neocucurbitaria sp. VM-36]
MPPAILPSSRCFVTQLLNSLPWSSQRTEEISARSNPLTAVPDAVKKQLLSLQVLFPNEFVPALDLLDRRLVTRFHIRKNGEACAVSVVPQPGHNHNEALQNQHKSGVKTFDEQMMDQNSSATTTLESARLARDGPDSDQAEDEAMLDAPAQESHITSKEPANNDHSTIYYVRSAQQRSSRYNTSYDTTTSYEVRLTAWNCSCPAFAFSAFPAIHPEPPVATSEFADMVDVTMEHTTRQDCDVGWIFGGVSLGDGMPPVCKHLLACVLVEKCSGIFGSYVEEKDVSVEEAAGWAAGWGD